MQVLALHVAPMTADLSDLKSTVNHLNETVDGSTCLLSKTRLILKQKTNIFPIISQLMLDFINCHENA